MSQCQCTSTPFILCTPPPSGVDTYPECDNIRMFFGYDLPTSSGSIGALKNLYYTDPITVDDSKRGFIINKYSFQELVDTGILPAAPSGNIFRLTEAELLSTVTYESWISYNIMQFCAISKGQITNPNQPLFDPDKGYFNFGYACFHLLQYNFNNVLTEGYLVLTSLLTGDTSDFFARFLKLVGVPDADKFTTGPATAYPTSINVNTDPCTYLRRGQIAEKFYLCYEWIKNIHDTYYGKQFLVKISPPSGYQPTNNFQFQTPEDQKKNDLGICISDISSPSGAIPTLIENARLGYGPCFIDGDGSSQGFYVSDEISGDGGFPHQTDTDLIGLKNITSVLNESGKIDSFARIGFFSQPSATPPSGCSFKSLTTYKKFQYKDESGNNACRDWTMDTTKMDPSSIIIETDSYPSGIYETLFTRCSFESRFYIDQNGTWVPFTLNDKIPLKLEGADLNQAFVIFSALLDMTDKVATSYGLTINNSFINDLLAPSWIPVINKIVGAPWDYVSKFLKFKTKPKTSVLGALGNTHQLNLATINSPCLIPEGVVVPFKSNVYKYGPYYYSPLDSGPLVETIVEENLVPWNFIDLSGTQQSCQCCSLSQAYSTMNDYGKELVSASAKKLNKLETAKITVVGLPCYCLGHSVDDVACVNGSGAVGPTLLTDMNVEYGSGGFNTTYNFSTYSPRLGRPEKYIRDLWGDKIKLFQTRNKFRLEQKNKLIKLSQQLKFRNINGVKGGGGRDLFPRRNIFRNDSTANRLMFSGYYLDQDPSYNDPTNSYIAYTPVTGVNPNDPPCEKVICEPTPFDLEPINVSGTPYRLYSFTDVDKAYSDEYIQNTYYQLAGMSLDGLYLPVSLRGVHNDPVESEYERENYDNDRDYKLYAGRLKNNPLWENNGKLPRFAMRCENSGRFIEWDKKREDEEVFDNDSPTAPGKPIPSKTRDEIPPFKLLTSDTPKDAYSLSINQRYLNPLLSTKNLIGDITNDNVAGWDDRKNNTNKGFVISSIVFGQDHNEYQISHHNEDCRAVVGGYGLDVTKTDEFIRQQYKNFRVPALRGPLILQGWGYDTSGKPIPNLNDDHKHAELGQFRKDKLTDKFLDNWIQNPKTWPVGPVDLRFDRERGVWTCPSPNKIVVARLKEPLFPYGIATAELINPSAGDANPIKFYQNYGIWGPNGENIKLSLPAAEITIYDYLGISLCACDIVYAYYDDNKYIVLESNRSYMDPTKPCDPVLCTTTTTTTTTATTTTPTVPPCYWGPLEFLRPPAGSDAAAAINYNPTAKQILGHTAGVDGNEACLIWYDINECTPTTPLPCP